MTFNDGIGFVVCFAIILCVISYFTTHRQGG